MIGNGVDTLVNHCIGKYNINLIISDLKLENSIKTLSSKDLVLDLSLPNPRLNRGLIVTPFYPKAFSVYLINKIKNDIDYQYLEYCMILLDVRGLCNHRTQKVLSTIKHDINIFSPYFVINKENNSMIKYCGIELGKDVFGNKFDYTNIIKDFNLWLNY